MITRSSLILVAALVGLSPALTIGTGPARAVDDCDFEFTRTVPTVLGAQITGSGWAACADVPPDSHSLTLALEYEDRGRWVVAARKTDATVPPRYPSRHSYDVSAACYAGTWRVVVAIRGTIQGHTFRFDNVSNTRDVSGPHCPNRF